MTIRSLDNTFSGEIALFYKDNFLDGWTETMLKSAFSTGRFYAFGAYEEEKLLGVITCSKTDDTMDIEDIVVDKNSRRKSIGSLLLRFVLDNIDKTETKKVLLEVREGNTAAINLYYKFGFSRLSVRKKYYSDGENALVMIKETTL